MFESLYPDKFQKSTYEIPFEQLYERGYRGILFDIDNTLVPHGAPADDRAIALFQRLRAIGFKTCLISNNREPRVKSFCDQVGSLYIYKAGKPLPKRHEEDGHHGGGYIFCGRSDLYRCAGREARRSLHHSGGTDSSEGGDPDCPQTVSGEDHSLFLF